MYIFSMSVFFHFLCLLLCQGEQLVATAVCNYVKYEDDNGKFRPQRVNLSRDQR